MNKQKKAIAVSILDTTVLLQKRNYKIGSSYGIWEDTSVSPLEAHKMFVKYGTDYRIRPTTVSLPAVELPKPYHTGVGYDSGSFEFKTVFKSKADAQAWADYLNKALRG